MENSGSLGEESFVIFCTLLQNWIKQAANRAFYDTILPIANRGGSLIRFHVTLGPCQALLATSGQLRWHNELQNH